MRHVLDYRSVLLLKRLLLVRHAHARSNADDRVSSSPPGEGLSELGVEEALALREAIAHEPFGSASRRASLRTQETLELALGERDVPSASSSRRSTRSAFGVVRGRAARRLPELGLDERARRSVPGRRREPGATRRDADRRRRSTTLARRAPRSPRARGLRTPSDAVRARRIRRAFPAAPDRPPSRTRRRSPSTPTRSSCARRDAAGLGDARRASFAERASV